jgi:AcrR family transcriptional regulator
VVTDQQRRTRADGERTRQAILHEAVGQATIDGLEGLTIGNLAKSLGMSKSGLYAHFGSKEELQLATVEEASRIFEAAVVRPALAVPAGRARVLAVCDAFFDYLLRRTFPGGCFFAAATLEMGTHPGPVRARVAEFQLGFEELIRHSVTEAVELGELPAGEDPKELAFELGGIILASNVTFVLSDDTAGLDLARRVVRRRLGMGPPNA